MQLALQQLASDDSWSATTGRGCWCTTVTATATAVTAVGSGDGTTTHDRSSHHHIITSSVHIVTHMWSLFNSGWRTAACGKG
jgi:hypothetical protein